MCLSFCSLTVIKPLKVEWQKTEFHPDSLSNPPCKYLSSMLSLSPQIPFGVHLLSTIQILFSHFSVSRSSRSALGTYNFSICAPIYPQSITNQLLRKYLSLTNFLWPKHFHSLPPLKILIASITGYQILQSQHTGPVLRLNVIQ